MEDDVRWHSRRPRSPEDERRRGATAWRTATVSGGRDDDEGRNLRRGVLVHDGGQMHVVPMRLRDTAHRALYQGRKQDSRAKRKVAYRKKKEK